MNIYTLTQHTKDHGDKVICRRHEVNSGGSEPKEVMYEGSTVEEVREQLLGEHPDLVNVGRYANDDPVIVESWV